MPRRWTEKELALPDGAWRIDPFTRVQRFVPAPPPPRKRRKPPKPCGTVAAYQRHRAHGEDPCDACATANTQARRKQRLDKAAQAFKEDAA